MGKEKSEGMKVTKRMQKRLGKDWRAIIEDEKEAAQLRVVVLNS